MKILIITKKIWDHQNFYNLSKNFIVHKKINISEIKKMKPKVIFFIHWSKKINEYLYKNFFCIQFHSSSLPKGKGGSPIQNQILQNKKKNKINSL